MAKVNINNEVLEDKKVSALSNGLQKVKAIYANADSFNEAMEEITETTEELTHLATAEDNDLFLGLYKDDEAYVITAVYENINDEQQASHTLFIAYINKGQKVYLPDPIFSFIDSLLAIKDIEGLHLNGWAEISGGMLEFHTPREKKSLKQRMAEMKAKK
jgi:hypothetical protein